MSVEPSYLSEALTHSHWREAIQNEIDALKRNKTWFLTPLPIGKKALSYKWIVKSKENQMVV